MVLALERTCARGITRHSISAVQHLTEVTLGVKVRAIIGKMARPERFERPTLRFVV